MGSTSTRAAIVLARVDTVEITDADFVTTVAKLDASGADRTLDQWRRRLQILIDRQLLFMEAHKRGFYDSSSIEREVTRWERSRLIDQLIKLEMKTLPAAEDDAARQIFLELGGDREVGIGMLTYTDRKRATAALKRARAGDITFEELADLYPPALQPAGSPGHLRWHSPLTVRAPHMLSVLRSGVGASELVEGEGRHVLIMAVAERTVAFEQRRERAERTAVQRRRTRAQRALISRLVKKYEVEVSGPAVADLRNSTATEIDRSVPLVRSSSGEWTVGEYIDIAGLPPAAVGEAADSDRGHALEARIVHAFAHDRLLDQEARAAGVQPPSAQERQMERDRKAIEALWDEEALNQISVSDADIRQYIAEHRERYGADLMVPDRADAVWTRATRELKEERAKPLFEVYLVDLRRRYGSLISVDEERFFSFVSRLRRDKAPVQM